jgi:signal peptidase I
MACIKCLSQLKLAIRTRHGVGWWLWISFLLPSVCYYSSMIQSLTKSTLPLLFSLLWPGTGHIALRNYFTGVFFGSFPLLLTALFVISRFIVNHDGLAIYTSLLLTNYLMAIGHCCYLVFTEERIAGSTYIRALLLPLVALPFSAILFTYKNALLGIGFFQIPSTSMLPTIQVGDIIAVDTWRYHAEPPKRADIIVFSLEDTHSKNAAYTHYIKRITAIENDTVNQRGELINQKNIHSLHDDTFTVNNNEVFVMGDNRAISKDSRHYGMVNSQNIIGKGQFIIVRGKAHSPFNWDVYGTQL